MDLIYKFNVQYGILLTFCVRLGFIDIDAVIELSDNNHRFYENGLAMILQ